MSEATIRQYRLTLGQCLPHDRMYSVYLSDLASALIQHFGQVGDQKALDEGIACARQAVELQPLDHPHRFGSLINLSAGLIDRFRQTGAPEDNEAAICCSHEALELIDQNHPERASILNNLVNALINRFQASGHQVDLENAVSHSDEAVQLQPIPHPGRFRSLTNRAAALGTRFAVKGDRADLNMSILCNHDALELIPLKDPLRAPVLVNLAISLRTRFEQAGNDKDLEEAILFNRQALELKSHQDQPTALSSLAVALRTRFRDTKESKDIDEAIRLHEEALELRPIQDPHRSSDLSNLASALRARFAQSKDRTDLDRAIDLHREALSLQNLQSPARSVTLNSLGSALLSRYGETGEDKDLDTGIEYYREALKLGPEGHPERFSSLGNLARSLLARFLKHEDFEDLAEGYDYEFAAAQLIPPGHPNQPISHRNRAGTLCQMIPYASNPTDIQNKAFQLYRDATSMKLGNSNHALLSTSLAWILAAEDCKDPSILDAYRSAFKALEQLSAGGRSLESRLARLTRASAGHTLSTETLAANAAACAISLGFLEVAVELLEQGRTLLLTQAGKYRTLVDDLEFKKSGLAIKFRELSRQMDQSVMSSNRLQNEGQSLLASRDVVGDFQKLRKAWDAIVERIRECEGFESFLRAKPFAMLQEAAKDGPIILVNVADKRSDAIIVLPHDPPHLVPLPNAGRQQLQRIETNIRRDVKRVLVDELRKIWNTVVSPVVEKLQADLKILPGSRIWWCASGIASRLPLHAAGDYTAIQQNLPDLYISSYTTTINSLLRARRAQGAPSRSTERLLVVSQPNTPGQTKLSSVNEEVGCLEGLFPSASVLREACATREAVLGALDRHNWIHFACHGHVDQLQPFNSNFSLHDNPLTLLDIIGQHIEQPELAFLSACHSAAGTHDLPDEALHLASGLQFAGYRSVVGTLWAMADKDGPQVADTFWRNVIGCQIGKPEANVPSAKALHRAVVRLRELEVPPHRWACFVHLGD